MHLHLLAIGQAQQGIPVFQLDHVAGHYEAHAMGHLLDLELAEDEGGFQKDQVDLVGVGEDVELQRLLVEEVQARNQGQLGV